MVFRNCNNKVYIHITLNLLLYSMGGFGMVIAKCDSCAQEYQLGTGENPADFQCECGGELNYSKQLEQIEEDSNEPESTVTCPYCGAETPRDKKICMTCHKFLKSISTYQKSDKSYPGYLSTSKSTKSIINLDLKWEIVGIGFASTVMLGIVGAFIFGPLGLILAAAMGGFIATFLGAENTGEGALYGGLSGALGMLVFGIIVSIMMAPDLLSYMSAFGLFVLLLFLIILLIIGGICGLIGGVLGAAFK